MSMLAEPRRKQKVINLRAKNNAWSNDTNKFGQRMLEKMGWSTGKGLGAKENGIVEHIIARYKNDDKGLGYEDRNDQWTKHEDDFNALLANLSNEKDSSTETLHSGVSLEVKSKKSKARIHYHKFTRGKDISRYSVKELANIFGKKSFQNEEVKETAQEDLKTTEQVFTEKGSMVDYFKTKMAALKTKSKVNVSLNENSNENCDFAFRGFSVDVNDENFNNVNIDSTLQESASMFEQEKHNEDEQEQQSIKKSKKKKSKGKEVSVNNSYEPDFAFQGFSLNHLQEPIGESIETSELIEKPLEQVAEVILETEVLKKKKKKSKIECNIQENASDNNINDTEYVKTKKLKKKKNKNNTNDINKSSLDLEGTCIETEESIVEEDYVPKKKKKRKNKDL